MPPEKFLILQCKIKNFIHYKFALRIYMDPPMILQPRNVPAAPQLPDLGKNTDKIPIE